MGIKAVFGANVKLYRKRKGISQEELSEKLDIGPNHLSKIECGRAFVSAELLEHLVHALDIPAAALFQSAGEENSGLLPASRQVQACVPAAAARFERIVEQELRRAAKVITRRICAEPAS